MSSAESSPAHDARAELASDARALKRGVLVNAAGYAVKLGMPVLLAFGTRTYGAARWGVFVTLQALVMILLRVAILGFDKAMLWWIPNRGRDGYGALRPALFSVVLASVACGALASLVGEPLLRAWKGVSGAQLDSLRIMLLGLPPFAAAELLLHASMGRRRMDASVIVRETLTPAALIAFALVLHAAQVVETGLAWAFVLANLLGLAAAALFHFQIFGTQLSSSAPQRRVPRELFGYALPLWLSEILNATLMRVNAIAIAVFTDPVTVGVWGVVMQFGTALRTIRGAFDSIVTVLAADIARNHDSRRLSSTLSYAARLVTLTQLPLFAFLFIFADVILPLYGAAFARGSRPLIVLCAFFLANGAAGLAGVVLAGYGKSRLTLLNTVVTLVLQALLLWWLVPRYGLTGGAIAVGASYSAQHVLQLLQLRLLTGRFHFSRSAARPLLPAALAACAAAATHTLIATAGHNPWTERTLTFGAFLLIYGAFTFWSWRRGDLRAVPASPPDPSDTQATEPKS